MTPTQIELARHALGLPNRNRVSYRNHYVTGQDAPEHREWCAMVDAGEARRGKPSQLTGGDDCFWLTAKGAALALHAGEALNREDFKAWAGA